MGIELDNGQEIKYFIPMPKALGKKIRETKLNDKERNLIDIIIEETLGYVAHKGKARRTSKAMSANFLMLKTGYSYSSVRRLIKSLSDRNIICVGEVWFNKQKTNDIGINLDLSQWDKKGFLPKKEYEALYKRAIVVVKDFFDKNYPKSKLEKGRRRDKVDFIDRTSRARISVQVKPTWGLVRNWDKIELPYKPDVWFCIMNVAFTEIAVILPSRNRDLQPKDDRLTVPFEKNPKGEDRIIIKKVGSSVVTPVTTSIDNNLVTSNELVSSSLAIDNNSVSINVAKVEAEAGQPVRTALLEAVK